MYPNGDSYSGWWRDGLKEGKGTYIFAHTGMQIKGDWVGGQMKKGQWQLPNGAYLEGNFDFNKPNGEACWFFPNGNSVTGEYK